jgi:tetratricopeptide (TPR) repeat protein
MIQFPLIRLSLLGLLTQLLISCATPQSSPKTQTESASRPDSSPPHLSVFQAQRVVLAAVDLLEAGNEDQAKADLQRALAADPGNRLAQNLLQQITVNPMEALGRESFTYRVQPNETLSRIAGRFLGDIYSFYILARYNDIKVPRQVAGGQVIRIPGKAPPPGSLTPLPSIVTAAATSASPSPSPSPSSPTEPSTGEKTLRLAEQLEKSGDLEEALTEYRKAAGQDQPEASEKAEQIRRRLLARHTASARTAFAKQDLDGAIQNWDRVLTIDPSNEMAKLERQKAITLKEKVKAFK